MIYTALEQRQENGPTLVPGRRAGNRSSLPEVGRDFLLSRLRRADRAARLAEHRAGAERRLAVREVPHEPSPHLARPILASERADAPARGAGGRRGSAPRSGRGRSPAGTRRRRARSRGSGSRPRRSRSGRSPPAGASACFSANSPKSSTAWPSSPGPEALHPAVEELLGRDRGSRLPRPGRSRRGGGWRPRRCPPPGARTARPGWRRRPPARDPLGQILGPALCGRQAPCQGLLRLARPPVLRLPGRPRPLSPDSSAARSPATSSRRPRRSSGGSSTWLRRSASPAS